MSAREAFEALREQVCEEAGWTASKGGVEVVFPDGRRQRVGLEFFDFEGSELVRFHTTIGSSERIEPLRLTTALRLNFGLPHGSLALKNELLVMVDTLLVKDADPDEIRATIRYLAETADHFEKTMFGGDRF